MARFGMKLALLVMLVAAAAAAVTFFVVVPQLQTRLENQRLGELERVAPTFTPLVAGAVNKEIKATQLEQLVRSIAARSGAEVTLSDIQLGAGARPRFAVLSNSRDAGPVDASLGLQRLASSTRRAQGAIVDGRSSRTAQVAVPVPFAHPAWVLLYTRDVSDVHGTVSLFARRALIAGGIALVIALIAGYLLARRSARADERLTTASARPSGARSPAR